MEPGAYLVIVENDSSFTSLFPDVKNYIGETGFGLSGSGEFMKLVSSNGQIIDSLTYDDNSPWPDEADGNGSTLELIDADKDNSLPVNWKASQGHGTPGSINSAVTAVKNVVETSVPKEFALSQNYPNPFNPSTIIRYQVSVGSKVQLKIYDLLGREVATLIDEYKPAGYYSINISNFSKTQSSGVYFYTLRAGEFIQTKKMVFLK